MLKKKYYNKGTLLQAIQVCKQKKYACCFKIIVNQNSPQNTCQNTLTMKCLLGVHVHTRELTTLARGTRRCHKSDTGNVRSERLSSRMHVVAKAQLLLRGSKQNAEVQLSVEHFNQNYCQLT